MAKRDFRKETTDKLIEIIESGQPLPWDKGWRNVAVSPFNPFSGSQFRKGNKFNLLCIQSSRGSIDPRWMTLKQINKAGLSLRAGSKAALVEYWNIVEKDLTNESDSVDTEKADSDKSTRPSVFSRIFYEFNGEDIIGLPELSYAEPSFNTNEMVERLVAATGAQIEHRTVTVAAAEVVKDAAFFSHSADVIVLPPKGAFNSEAGYYATLLHELVHWTGHHTRLNRRAEGEQRQKDSPAYAREELRAEYGAALLTSMFALDAKAENHASYLKGYLELLRGDKNEIFRAASDVEGIVDYLFEFDPELRQILEGELVSENRLTDESGSILKSDGPVNQADLGGLPNFSGVKEPVFDTPEFPWAAYQTAIEKEFQKEEILTMPYFHQMSKQPEKERFETFLAGLSEPVTRQQIQDYAQHTFVRFRNTKCFVDVWKTYEKYVDKSLSNDGFLAGKISDHQREAFSELYEKQKLEMGKLATASKDGTYEEARNIAMQQAKALWGGDDLTPPDANKALFLLDLINERWPSVAASVMPEIIEPEKEAEVSNNQTTNQSPVSDVSSRYMLDDESDDEFIPQPVFDGEQEDLVIGTLGNSLSYDSPQP
ncbi:ArdC family protein [Citrobacter freundii]|uniref:ArdC family protein n=1 Tax=Citrobacter freundii TaxID=546 RepID=UPI001905AAD6|nr:zincin-like metallopeptidase domain-containing protein [Citrobacter freundii]MBJ8931644.1 DUF1738 domain-containing protein [Citrobacter freundii]